MTAQIDVAKEQTVTVTYTNQYQPLMVVPTGSREQDVSYNPDRNSRRNRRRVFLFLRRKRKEKIHEIKRRDSSFSDSSCISSVFLWVLFGLLFGITTMKNNDMSPRISAGDLLFYYRLEKPKAGMWWFFRKQERNMWAE